MLQYDLQDDNNQPKKNYTIRILLSCILFFIVIIATINIAISSVAFSIYDENKEAWGNMSNDAARALSNAHDASKKLKEITYNQDSTITSIQNIVKAADENKNMFVETRNLLVHINAPLKDLAKMVGTNNRQDLHSILSKIRANLDHLGDGDAANLVHSISDSVAPEKIVKLMKLIGDVDDTVKRVQLTMNRIGVK